MKIKKYILILTILVMLGIVSVAWGLFQSLIIGSTLWFMHGLMININKEYRSLINREIGLPIEECFSDKDIFYKELGVNTNNKLNKFFNSEMFLGLFMLLQTLIKKEDLFLKLKWMDAILIGTAILIGIILFDVIFLYLAKKSKSYSDFYWRTFFAAIVITIPLMTIGLIWIGARM